MSASLSDHVRSDEKVHNELKEGMKKIGEHIRKWALVGGIMGGILGHAIHALEGCNGALPGRPTALDLSTYQNEQISCVLDYQTKVDIDSCRVAYRTEWCTRFPNEVNCMKDGGTDQ